MTDLERLLKYTKNISETDISFEERLDEYELRAVPALERIVRVLSEACLNAKNGLSEPIDDALAEADRIAKDAMEGK